MQDPDIPTNWRERNVDPATFAFIIGTPFQLPEEIAESSIIRCAHELIWSLLLKRMDEIAEMYLTSHQKRVYELWIKKGHTYQEIGALLSEVNGYSCDYSAYTAISHCIKGIRSNKHGGRYHGGIENRLRKRCEKDEIFQEMLSDWKKLQANKIQISLDFLQKHDKWYQERRKQLEVETEY